MAIDPKLDNLRRETLAALPTEAYRTVEPLVAALIAEVERLRAALTNIAGVHQIVGARRAQSNPMAYQGNPGAGLRAAMSQQSPEGDAVAWCERVAQDALRSA